MVYGGPVIKEERTETIDLCARFAANTFNIPVWSFNTKTKECYLKRSNSERDQFDKSHFVSGSSDCGVYSSLDYHLQGKGSHKKRSFYGQAQTENKCENVDPGIKQCFQTKTSQELRMLSRSLSVY